MSRNLRSSAFPGRLCAVKTTIPASGCGGAAQLCSAKKLTDHRQPDKSIIDGPRLIEAPAALLRVFEAESLRVFVIGEQFAITAKIDDGAQGPLGIILGHIIL